ncbi:MAG: hypothetical protein IPF62_12160 [Bacteroidetes bacterium]|nr:hypothetical protein [Bacteroidota bacterium]
MLSKGIHSNVVMFTLLISLSPDFEQGFRLLEYMITEKDKMGKRIKPNERTRKAIENKTYGNTELINKVAEWFMKMYAAEDG